MASVTASEIAQAINSILQFDCKDQEGLLDVVSNYFCATDQRSDSEDSDS